MNFFRYLRNSFSARLSLWVTGFVTAIFVVALILLFRFSRAVLKDEALEQNMEMLEHAALQVDRIIHQTEMTAKTVGWMISQHRRQPTVVSALCRETMQVNPLLDSCYVVVKGTGSWADSSPRQPVPMTTAGWQSPLLDAATDIVDLKPMVLVYHFPVTDGEGKPLLTLALNVQVDWQDIVRSHVIDPMPYARCYLTGAKSKDRRATSGYQLHQNEGLRLYHFYRPLNHTEWGLAMLCSERDTMAGYNRMQTTSILIIVAVLLLLLLICRLIIDYNLKPLDLLSVKVHHISKNHFHEPIPTSKRLDEIGELQRSFSAMQQSLTSHLSEMHQKTAELEERNQELQTAYERGREDERTKTAFLGTISEKIVEPVDGIQAATNHLSARYESLTKEDMNQLQQEIIVDSHTITALIDQTLIDSQEATVGRPREGELSETMEEAER